jgi:hypothetical protein
MNMTDLPPPAQVSNQSQFDTLFSQYPAVTQSVDQWRTGHQRESSAPSMYPTPVLHTEHPDYSSIEVAKRKQKAAQLQDIRKRQQPRPQPQTRTRNMVFQPAMAFPNYNSIMRLRLPRGLR